MTFPQVDLLVNVVNTSNTPTKEFPDISNKFLFLAKQHRRYGEWLKMRKDGERCWTHKGDDNNSRKRIPTFSIGTQVTVPGLERELQIERSKEVVRIRNHLKKCEEWNDVHGRTDKEWSAEINECTKMSEPDITLMQWRRYFPHRRPANREIRQDDRFSWLQVSNHTRADKIQWPQRWLNPVQNWVREEVSVVYFVLWGSSPERHRDQEHLYRQLQTLEDFMGYIRRKT